MTQWILIALAVEVQKDTARYRAELDKERQEKVRRVVAALWLSLMTDCDVAEGRSQGQEAKGQGAGKKGQGQEVQKGQEGEKGEKIKKGQKRESQGCGQHERRVRVV